MSAVRADKTNAFISNDALAEELQSKLRFCLGKMLKTFSLLFSPSTGITLFTYSPI